MTTIEKIVFKAVPENEFKEQYEIYFNVIKNKTVKYDDFIKTFYLLMDRNLFHLKTDWGVRYYKRKTTIEILIMIQWHEK